MSVLVDTSVWSLALRKQKLLTSQETIIIHRLKDLIENSMIKMIGPIRQEILSGIASPTSFTLLKNKLYSWEDLKIDTFDYVRAAEMFNICRKHGIQGSHIDFLICAVSERHDLSIFTLDKDFILYAKHLPIRLNME